MASKWLVLSLIIFLGLSMAAALTVSARIESELLLKSVPMQDASMMIKNELSHFHMMVEEYVYERKAGTMDVGTIWTHLDRAEWLGKAMLSGGKDREWTYVPLEDVRLRDEINAMNGEFREMHSLAEKMMGEEPGSPEILEEDDRLDTVLERAYAKADIVEDELHRTIREKRSENSRIIGGILLLCALFTTGAAAVTFRYISAEKRARDELSEARTFLQNIIDGVDEPIMVVDRDYNITLMNLAARRLSGDGPEAAMKCHEFSHGLDVPCDERGFVCPLKEVVWSGQTMVVEHEHFGDHKAPSVMEVIASPWRDSSGSIRGIIQCARDVSERKKLERQRADFYAMVTHDIKSPLMAITGYTDIILHDKSGQLDEEAAEMIMQIRKGSEKLQTLVLDFLSVSQMEAGMLKIKTAPADITALLGETCAEMEKVFINKGLSFGQEIAEDLPRSMMLDYQLVQRAVSNLLSNAAEYTPSGGEVRLVAERVSMEGGESVAVLVKDTGSGIPVEEQARIFDKYYRSVRTAGIKGSGLGLAIVKTVAQAHGGAVEVESEPGKGSTFKLFIPVRQAS